MSETWDSAAAAARRTFEAAWAADRERTPGVVRALTALGDELAARMPVDEAPASGSAAIFALRSDAEASRRRALELFEQGDVAGAIEAQRAAIAMQVERRLLPDVASMLTAAGRGADARQVLIAALALDPDDANAAAQLAALDGRPGADLDNDVTDEWRDTERRPRPDPGYLMDYA